MPLYYAFGSNLSRARLAARVDIERVLGRASLGGWRFACNKHGSDASAKANIVRAEGAEVWGVVYELSKPSLARLDAFEGGYVRTEVEVEADDHGRLVCFTYVSSRLTTSLRPFDWYKEHMVVGAEEHGLPASYIAHLRALPSLPSAPK